MGNKGTQVYENKNIKTSERSISRKGAIMSPGQIDFLNQRHLPHRLTAQETGWLLGFSAYDITVLAAKRMLKPVGRPAQNSTKYYSTAQVQQLSGLASSLPLTATAIFATSSAKRRPGKAPAQGPARATLVQPNPSARGARSGR